ncbi:MAG: peptidase T [Spirochaetaceae bacterium]|nr:peptidase T [Spirochaetaceae bacterium]
MDLQADLLDRFISYVKIDTRTNLANAGKVYPTCPNQLALAKMLAEELKGLGLEVYNDDKAFVIAHLKANSGTDNPIAFMAHLDTAEDVTATNVSPQVYKNYDGKAIKLKNNIIIDPAADPYLGKYSGDTIITADGTTLLGADDKAGIAAIMTAIKYLVNNPHIKHNGIEAVFTPDEEGGNGMANFPLDKLRSKTAYTLDGDELGYLEYECYNGSYAMINFKGVPIHPGTARGKMVNALSMAAAFINLIPRSESPEATDGYYGCYWPQELKGHTEQATLEVILRDHNAAEIERRAAALHSFAAAVEAAFPHGKITVELKEEYRNMREAIEKQPEVMQNLLNAVKKVGVTPIIKPIRGGTDGAKLTALGVPCPNIFTGGHNFHGYWEWLSLSSLEKACLVVIELVKGE